jgi:hypothetical protein
MKNLFKALAGFQQEVPAIHEGTKGYGYTYSDLKTIFKVINPIMAKHNLGFTQLVEDSAIRTIIFHTESGESIETTCKMPSDVQLKGMNAFQVAGSAITYYRRYSLSAALGLVTDVDSDATGEQVKAPKKQTLTDERFSKALEAVKTGSFDPAELEEKYELTEAQQEQLNAILA